MVPCRISVARAQKGPGCCSFGGLSGFHCVASPCNPNLPVLCSPCPAVYLPPSQPLSWPAHARATLHRGGPRTLTPCTLLLLQSRCRGGIPRGTNPPVASVSLGSSFSYSTSSRVAGFSPAGSSPTSPTPYVGQGLDSCTRPGVLGVPTGRRNRCQCCRMHDVRSTYTSYCYCWGQCSASASSSLLYLMEMSDSLGSSVLLIHMQQSASYRVLSP